MSEPHPFDADTIAAAEILANVEYTPEERAQLMDALEAQMARLAVLRTLSLDNGESPAERFDPRLPSTVVPSASRCEIRAIDRPLPERPVDIAFASVSEQRGWLARGVLTSRRLTEIYLERMERLGPALECIVTATPELALAQADAADRAMAAGETGCPLRGIPWLAKDLLDTAGIATTWGAEPFTGRVPCDDAAVVSKLHEAGAVLLGKSSLGALASGDVWHAGDTRNPWNLGEGSSGSSAGSGAAVAAGLCGFAIGSETMGSILSPAMRCGIVGLRPTFGRVSRHGAMALCWSLDKLGPMVRRAEDAAVVLDAIAGPDVRDPTTFACGFDYQSGRSVEGVRVGWIPASFREEGTDACERAVLDVLASLGCEMVEVTLPDLPYDALWTILEVEASACFEALTLSGDDDALKRQDDHAWPNTFRKSRFVPAIDLIQSSRLRGRVMRRMAEVYQDVDVIVGPTFSGPMQLITNMTGHPAATLPVGFVERGSRPRLVPRGTQPAASGDGETFRAPQGIALWGDLFAEPLLITLSVALEEASGCWRERPPIAETT